MSKNQSDSATPSSTEGLATASKNALGAHKGKLAIGAAVTLGLMVYYKWREKQLAKDDPEEYARLQRLKAGLTNGLEEEDSSKQEQIREVKRPRKEAHPKE